MLCDAGKELIEGTLRDQGGRASSSFTWVGKRNLTCSPLPTFLSSSNVLLRTFKKFCTPFLSFIPKNYSFCCSY